MPQVTDPDGEGVIRAYVPLTSPASSSPSEPRAEVPAPRRRGRKKGTPNKPKPPRDEFDVEALRVPENAESGCPGCSRETMPLDLRLVRELARASRDRLEGASPELRAHMAESDVMYLAARLDGFCGLGCWKEHQV